MEKYNPFFSLVARVFLVTIFLFFGIGKAGTTDAMQAFIESVGLPGVLVYPTIACEVGAALAIIVGFQTRFVALALAAFSLMTAIVFHMPSPDNPVQIHLFLRNIGMAGGLIFLALHGVIFFNVINSF